MNSRALCPSFLRIPGKGSPEPHPCDSCACIGGQRWVGVNGGGGHEALGGGARAPGEWGHIYLPALTRGRCWLSLGRVAQVLPASLLRCPRCAAPALPRPVQLHPPLAGQALPVFVPAHRAPWPGGAPPALGPRLGAANPRLGCLGATTRTGALWGQGWGCIWEGMGQGLGRRVVGGQIKERD